MSGICGWLGDAGGSPASVVERMQGRFSWPEPAARACAVGANWGLAAAGPPGTILISARRGLHIALQGHPIWRGVIAQGPELDALAEALTEAYGNRGSALLDDMGGDFALAIIDERGGSALLAIDRIGVRNVVYQQAGATLVFGATSDIVASHPLARSTVDPQGLYDYVYFHMVPGPRTVYREHQRLAAAHYLLAKGGAITTSAYWNLRFVEDRGGSVAELKPAFREALRIGVDAYASHGRCGAFLSGGTDSSTVVGLVREVTGAPASTYSIGFDAAGYDEMEYARIAARHFHTQHHEYYVTPADVVRAIPLVAAAYDQPFGNASAIPTFYCAQRARADGVECMLGGDGGDELFGGNARYAKQSQLARYEHLPAPARALLGAVFVGAAGASSVPFVRRARSYVEQARQPMPARYESYNLLNRLGAQNVFAADFLAAIDQRHPMDELTAVYGAADARSLINRMLALDIKFALADNDLPKVTRMCEIAGVDVAFPLLHEAVVDFSTSLPPDYKLRRTRLRYFFKEALRDFLPAATIAKQKHGFGLPAGVWLRDDPNLRQLASDALADLRKRRIFRDDLIDELIPRRLNEHAGYYGTLAWVLMMLEMWFRVRAAS